MSVHSIENPRCDRCGISMVEAGRDLPPICPQCEERCPDCGGRLNAWGTCRACDAQDEFEQEWSR